MHGATMEFVIIELDCVE